MNSKNSQNLIDSMNVSFVCATIFWLFLAVFVVVVKEIQERKDFLAEMEQIGEANKYRQVIEQQIQARVREMEKLKIKQ